MGRFEFSLPFSTLVSQSPFHPLSRDPFSPSRFPPSALFRFPSFSSPPPCRIGAQRKTHSIARRASSTTFLGFVFGRYLVEKRIFRKIIYINFYRIYLVKVAVCREVPTPPFTSPFSAVVVHVVWPSSLPRSPVVFSSYSEAQKRRGEGDGTAYASRKRERGGETGGVLRRESPLTVIFPAVSGASFFRASRMHLLRR